MIVTVFGQETFLARRFLQGFKERHKKNHKLSVVSCRDQDFAELRRDIASPSLFQDKILFLFENPFSAAEFSRQANEERRLFSEHPEHVFVFFEEGPVKNTDPLLKVLSKEGAVKEFSPLSGPELRSFVRGEFQRLGAKADKEALAELLLRSGHDLWQLSNEIAKVAAHAGSRAVEKNDVELLVPELVRPEIFKTLSAIAKKQRKQASALLSEHLRKGEAPLYLFSMFLYQLRLLLAAKEAGGTAPIQKALGAHRFAAQKALQEAQYFELSELKALYKKAFALDLALKTSKGDPEQLLYLFVGQASSKS